MERKTKTSRKTRTKINFERYCSLFYPRPMVDKGERGMDVSFDKSPFFTVFWLFMYKKQNIHKFMNKANYSLIHVY